MEHGMLMVVHNNENVVKKLIRLLDDKRFHFYILIDAKSELKFSEFKVAQFATVEEVSSMSVNWGGYSYTRAQFRLFKSALRNDKIEYFHMFQGADLPLKDADYIDAYFTRNKGKNFIYFSTQELREIIRETNYRLGTVHPFVDTKYYRNNEFIITCDRRFCRLQALFRREKEYCFHSALFSLDRNFTEYLVDREKQYEAKYRYSLSLEESLAGTVIMNSPFKDTLVKDVETWLIDWKRQEGASPHTFTIEDKEMIDAAMEQENYLFARKFVEARDNQIIEYIYDRLMDGEKSSL